MRTRQLAAALLAISMVSPLFVASLAVATSSHCFAESPSHASPPPGQPCTGSLLLVCCDDVATKQEANNPRTDLPSAPVANSPSHGVDPDPHGNMPSVLSDLAWVTAELRHSVVLRI